MQNVEFKAELRDPALARVIAKAAGVKPVVTLRQVDTYFRVVSGKMKRREAIAEGTEAEPIEVIRYRRDERPQPRLSFFEIYTEEEARERFGSLPLPVLVTIEKSRDVLMLEHARVHLDEIDGVGRFIEFETLVTPRHNVARAHELIGRLRGMFAPALGEPIAASYADLALEAFPERGGAA